MTRLRLAALLLVAFACDDPIEAGGEESAPAPERPVAGPSRAELIVMADRREPPESFAEALGAERAETRRLAARGLSRLHDTDALPLLSRALRDPDVGVRAQAALGLGALEQEAPPEAERLLLGALAAEGEADNRAAYLWDLGRIAGDGALGAFRLALAADAPGQREAACRGLAGYGLRGRRLDGALVRRVATRARDDEQAPVRLACAYALSRLAPPAEAPARDGVRDDLIAALDDSEPEVRAFAARALGAYGGAGSALARRAIDPDWQVAVQALRALGRHVQEDRGRVASAALRAVLDQALADGTVLETEAHVLITGLVALSASARFEPVFAVSREAQERLGEGEATRARGLCHCRAAALVDLGRGWPNAVDSCGLDQVSEDERRLLAVEVLAAGEGSVAQRAAFLGRLHRDGGSRVRQAVLGAIPSVAAPDLFDLVLEDLASDDVGVVIAACDATKVLAPIWAETVGMDAPVLSIRPAGEPAPAEPTPHRRGPALSRIHRGLEAAHETLSRADDLEGLQSWIGAVSAISDLGFSDELQALAGHANPALRAKAREVLPQSVEPPAPSPVANPLPVAEVPSPEPVEVVLHTEAGDVTLALDPEIAPTTVARFIGLAQQGYFDGLGFHRVVPAFVVQGGNPRGDGFGGPGWSQRCEDNRLRYERGTIGMALAGRDTGGSQFFIAHGPQPHLEGRYTAFGRVVEGMDVVDRLLIGARITSVE